MSWTAFAVAAITLATVAPAAGDVPRLACGGRANVSDTSVLIGGMEDSWRSLDGWAVQHASAGRRVCGYEYDSGRQTMSEAAAGLERDLDALASAGTRRLYITAYSMGGWIAKAALDSMARRGTIQRYERVELVALGTPWGGYTRANLPWHLRWFPLPGVARGIARMVQRPMAFEVGASSSFVRSSATRRCIASDAKSSGPCCRRAPHGITVRLAFVVSRTTSASVASPARCSIRPGLWLQSINGFVSCSRPRRMSPSMSIVR